MWWGPGPSQAHGCASRLYVCYCFFSLLYVSLFAFFVTFSTKQKSSAVCPRLWAAPPRFYQQLSPFSYFSACSIHNFFILLFLLLFGMIFTKPLSYRKGRPTFLPDVSAIGCSGTASTYDAVVVRLCCVGARKVDNTMSFLLTAANNTSAAAPVL